MHSRRESNALSCNAVLSCRCLLRKATTDEREKKKKNCRTSRVCAYDDKARPRGILDQS